MTRTSPVAASSLLLVTLAAPAAFADPPADSIQLSALDRASGGTDAGADLAFMFAAGDAFSGGFASRLDLHGQYLHPSGFGAYAALGVSKAFLSSDDPDTDMLVDAIDDETAITALELGGQYARALRPDFDLIAHAGVALPTASDGFGTFANAISQGYRITDAVLAAPDTTTLRLGVSPVFHRGAVFARADAGADIVLDAADGMDVDPLIHLNLAIGARRGALSGALEVATLGTTGDAEDVSARFMHTATLGVRYDLGRYTPALSVTTPLDDAGRGDQLAVAASFGARF